ncbi:hypothetical protein ACS0TY_004279 [Phlomoides rotata]
MLSTQRSEGMHVYFDDYMHSRCSLKEFMEQYEVAIGKKIQKEFIADFESKNKVKKCKAHYHWEKQFRDAFTNNMFLKFQEEIDRMVYCHIVPAPENDDDGIVEDVVQKFYVLDRSLRNNFRPEFRYKVEYRADGEYLNCQCHGFEFRGLICCHILNVMTMKDILSINERSQHMDKLKDKLIELKNEFLSSNNAGVDDQHISVPKPTDTFEVGGTPIRDPQTTRRKGRPRSNRLMPQFEINQRRSRGPRATRHRTTNGNNNTVNDHVVLREVDISLTLKYYGLIILSKHYLIF